ncbi:hypothetical protein D8I24_1008 [Cupriavidus necator H850]|nr:hypothetical protein D8I24_1008 [Cupriavidus necator H850]
MGIAAQRRIDIDSRLVEVSEPDKQQHSSPVLTARSRTGVCRKRHVVIMPRSTRGHVGDYVPFWPD